MLLLKLSVYKHMQKQQFAKGLDEFYSLSFASNKWGKWLKPESTLSYEEKAVLSGHYIYSSEEFRKLKDKINIKLEKSEFSLITNYIRLFITQSEIL